MKTIDTIKLSATKIARVQEGDGLITVSILQGNELGGYDVLQTKNFKKKARAVEFAMQWK